MGKTVPSWQTFINCANGSLIIRHLKEGLAEDLEIPWPSKLTRLECEKIRFQIQDLQPVLECGKTLDTISLTSCEIEPGALQIFAKASSLRCLILKACNISDADLDWLANAPRLELLDLSGNPGCTGAVTAQIAGAPLRNLYLDKTSLQDSDIPALLSFSQLKYLSISNTKVTGAALLQLAANRTLTVVCAHEYEGMAQFRAAQRQNWKKKTEYDNELAEKAFLLVKDFFSASQNRRQKRSAYVTQRYLDYCKAHGYNGVDLGQRVSFSEDGTPPYQDYRIVDVEQISRKKLYVYCEQEDASLSQYRYLVTLTDEGWQIDKSERLFEEKWCFWPLK